MTGNGSLYYVPLVVGMRVRRRTRYGERFGTLTKINRKTIVVTWDDTFNDSGERKQYLDVYARTNVFPVTP